MTQFQIGAARPQEPISGISYDSWVSPDGTCICEFYRAGNAFLLRFPDDADFRIDPAANTVEARPAPEFDTGAITKLFDNAIVPLLGNHAGGLFLHGSAVRTAAGAVAFLGHSRSGKTTLAGSFAKSGWPFMTEDVVDLELNQGDYMLRPKPSRLRLFKDSAEHLLGREVEFAQESGKQSVEAGEALPFEKTANKLVAIFVLGDDHAAPISVAPEPSSAALPLLLPHAFILDVEDRTRLKSHFGRLADLAGTVPVFRLDYPREYSALPEVHRAIMKAQEQDN